MDHEELGTALLKTIQQRAHIVWSSLLSDVNKCTASNIFINSAVEYYFWAVKFPIKVISEMDTMIRKGMNTNGAKHTNLTNCINYLRREQGGRGLRSLEETYKSTKMKLAIKLADGTDPRMKIVRKFHELSEQTNSFSIYKDASRYANEIGLTINFTEDKVSVLDTEKREEVATNYVSFSRVCKSKLNCLNYNELISTSWQGVNMVHRIQDENIINKHFNWMVNWRSCPTSVIQEFYLLFFQLLPTKQYKLIRQNEVIKDTRCRICNIYQQESVKHLLSNCNEFAKNLYMTRHNNALACFVWPLLKLLKLVEKCPVWYSNDKVAVYYKNEQAELWWDVPEYTGRDAEAAHPPRPDGKVKLEQSKEIYLLEMTVPWMENREEKLGHKQNKYNNILANLRFENPGYKVDQITLVMDCFGGYGKDLSENISKVIPSKKDVEMIITNMQKTIVSSCANLSRTFKIRTKGR